MKTAYGHDRPAGGCGSQRTVPFVTDAQGHQECRDIGLGNVAKSRPAGTLEMVGVAVEVAAVGRQGVDCEPALDGKMIEVRDHRPGHCRRPVLPARQPRTSRRSATGRPCASATGAYTTCPRAVLTP